MKAPKCKLCGVEHWASEPHHLTEKSLEAAVIEIAATGKPIAIKPTIAVIDKAKFDRNAYQREYMRERRARLKQSKTDG